MQHFGHRHRILAHTTLPGVAEALLKALIQAVAPAAMAEAAWTTAAVVWMEESVVEVRECAVASSPAAVGMQVVYMRTARPLHWRHW